MVELKVKYHLKELRNKKNLTVRELEVASGVSKSQICNIEREIKHPTVYTLCLLAFALEVEPYKLFSISVSREK